MERVGVYDARAKFSELIERAAGGEEVVITRRGKPIVVIVAAQAEGAAAVRRRTGAVRRIERMRAALDIRGVDIRRVIQAGRR